MNLFHPVESLRVTQRTSPASLLRTEAEAVPFQGRDAELHELLDWCESPVRLRVQFMVGAPGAGKTRLARELMRRCLDQGWDGGFLASNAFEDPRDGSAVSERTRRMLIAVDYAETRTGQVARLLEYAQHPPSTHPVRVLLIARGTADERWEVLRLLVNSFTDGTIMSLAPLYPEAASRRTGFETAVRAFALMLQGTAGAEAWPSSAERVRPPDDLTDDKYEYPLVLQMAALLALVESAATGRGADPRLALTAIGAAVEVYRGRVEQGHRELVPELIDVLRRQAEFLTARGSQRAALAAAEEAVALLRQVDAAEPGLMRLRADVQISYAAVLSALNRLEQASDAASEAVGLYRTLSTSDPEGALPGLARSLRELSVAHAALGRRTESLDVATELVGVYRHLTEARSGRYEADFAMALSTLSHALAEVGRRLEALHAATEAVERYRAHPDSDPAVLAALLNSLAVRLTEVGRPQEALDASEEATALRERLAADDPAVHGPDFASSLNNLALALGDVGRREEAVDRITQAVNWYRVSATANPGAYLPGLAASLNNLGVALTQVGRRVEAAECAAEALDLYRTLALNNPSAYTPDLANSLNNLSNAYAVIGRNESALELAREAAEIHAGLAESDPDVFRPNYAATLSNLASALSSAGEHDEALQAAERAVAVSRELAEANPATFQARLAAALNNLGILFSSSSQWAEATESLGEAVDIHRAPVVGSRAYGAYLPDFARSLENLAWAQRNSGNTDAAVRSISEAVRRFRGLAEENPAFKGDFARALTAFAELHADGTGAAAALGEAVVAGRAALATPSGRPEEDAKLYSNLSNALQNLSVVNDSMSLLDEAELAARQAVEIATAEDPARARYIERLASVLYVRYMRTGEASFLVEALEAARTAVAAATDGDPAPAIPDDPAETLHAANPGIDRSERFETMHALSQALRRSSRVWGAETGWVGEAHGAHDAELRSLFALAVWERHQSAALSNALLSHRLRTSDPEILSDAVAAAWAALAESPGEDPGRAVFFANLSASLLAEYTQSGDFTSLEEAVEAARKAVAETPAGHENQARYLAYLRDALLSRYKRTGELETLDETIGVARRVIDASAPGHPSIGRAWAELGTALRRRFDDTRDLRDAAEAAECFRTASFSTAPDHPHRARYLIELGSTLLARYGLDEEAESAREALAAFTAAAGVESASAATRLVASRSRGALAAQLDEWDEALSGYTEAIELLPRVFAGTHDAHRSEYLRQILELPQDAAAVALRTGRPELAARLLEHGRGVLVSLLLEVGSVFDTLAQREPATADRMQRLLSELAALDDPLSDDDPLDGPDPLLRGPRATLPAEWDDLVRHVRALPGFEKFLRAPSIEEMTRAASGGPVVMLNVSRYRCDAIIIDSTGVSCVPLPDLTYDGVVAKVASYRRAIEGLTSDTSIDTRMSAQAELRELLSWLWHVVAVPVLSWLELPSPRRENAASPRLWWCPTGLLAQLPVHAAGLAQDSVLDHVVSSYTPTVRALNAARERPQRRRASTQPIGLIVGVVSRQEGLLPGASRESELIANLIPRSNVLLDERATRAQILEAITACDWLHFVGHSVPNASGAGITGLDAFDHPITFSDVTALRLDHADLAFLSTNQAARRDTTVYDETVHLASGFAIAGFKHVIGTLWDIGDRIAVRTAADFYANLLSHELNFDIAAQALHQTVQHLRDRYPNTPSIWATYIHIGP